MDPTFRSARRCLAAISCLLAMAAAAQTYPTRPVTMVIPFPPGGGTDVAGRMFAKELGDRLGQNVIVDNRAGAAGNLGTASFARSPADGHTLLFTAQSPVTIADSVSPKLSFNPVKDLVPVAMTHRTPVLIVVPASLQANTLAEFIQLSNSRPRTLFFASPGTGNELHLAAEWLKKEAKIDMTHVPYKGSGPALQDLLAGRVHLLVASPGSVRAYIADGRLRAIATLSTQRLSGLPDVPTAMESGFPQLVYEAWFGLFVPAQTPDAIVKRLEKEASAMAASPGFQKKIKDMGLLPAAEGSATFTSTIQANRVVWSGLVRTLQLTEDIYK